ncbi:MAG TPA: DUF58 domain-containing protein [Acidimicrobiales bacterium]|nr:DUF58 domain-containing protein [Acidimicrobiales bacterium]
MTLTVHPRAVAYLVVAGACLFAAVALEDAPLAALGVPALLALVVGLVVDGSAAEREVSVAARTEQPVIYTGEKVTLKIELSAATSVPRCSVRLELPREVGEPGPARWTHSLRAGVPVTCTLEVSALVPGELSLGRPLVVVSGPFGLVARRVPTAPFVLSVRPREERVRSLPRTARVRVPAGDRLSRVTGDGIELAEVRPELPGDVARRINWRATARRNTPHVTLRHPEQSTDVVVFADTFEGPELTRVLEVSAGAAAAYLSRRDRVGLVSFGGVLDWVEAGSGRRQLDRIRSRLAGTSPFFSYAWKTIERIPLRAMPAGALVVAVSPLRDPRFVAAVADTRARGHDVVVVETSAPLPRLSPGDPPERRAAIMLTGLEHEDLRRRLFEAGIPVATLELDEPLEAALYRLREVMRRARPGRRR